MIRFSVICTLIFCVLLQRTTSQVIKNSGDAWGNWSPCSRTCGVGVMFQDRKCLDVTDDGSCPEPNRQYRTCNIQDCPGGSGDFRFEQCAKFNNRTLEGVKYADWVPYIPEHDVCGLNCMPKGGYFYYRWANKVTDGTRCGPESYDICINGKCQPLGCDLIMHSTAKEDKCRVCNGNGENCRTITGEYNGFGNHNYKEFLIIPPSATNILITEADFFGHYLALSDEKGKYFFNGNFEIKNPRTYKIAGALFRYERTDWGQETIRSLGPTTEPVHASVLLLDSVKNAGIKYEFSIPKHIKVLPKISEYKWKKGDYKPCSASCAGGYQTRNVVCIRVRDQKQFDENKCESKERPTTTRRCNTQSCPSRWFIGDWSSCSVTCGRGKQVRRIHCEHVIERGEPQMIPDDRCQSPKPISMRTCMLKRYCPTWNSAGWSQCSASCGEGRVSRQVACQDVSGKTLPDSSCDLNNKPRNVARCNPGPCTVKWIVTNWSPCYPRCGQGISTRMVYCVSIKNEDQKYPTSLCNNSTKPISRKGCVNEGVCTAMWHGSQWSRCTTSCGVGMQMRNVMCAVQDGNVLRIVSYKQCNASYSMPRVRKCIKRPCHSGWYIHQWEPCSRSCGHGIRRRDVTCMADSKLVPDGRWCNKKDKPVQFESCYVQACKDVSAKTTRQPTTTASTTTTERTTTETLITTQEATTRTPKTTKPSTTETPTTTQKPTTSRPTTTEEPTTKTPTTTQETTTSKPTTTEYRTTETPTTTKETMTPTTTQLPTTETPTTTQETTTSEPTTTEEPTTKMPTTTLETTTSKPTTQKTTTETPTTTLETTTLKPITTHLTTTETTTTATEKTTRKLIIREPKTTVSIVNVTIVQPPQDVVRYLNSEVLLKCRATGSPAPKITWRKEMMPVSAMGERFKVLEDGTLRINKLRSQDEGKYTCFASNFVTPLVSASCKLTVIVPVFTTIYPSNNFEITVGDDIALECFVQGKPIPRVTWYKDRIIISSSSNKTSHKLKIPKATLRDAGTYECHADHGYGSHSASVAVDVNDAGYNSPETPTTKEVCSDRKDLYCVIVKTVKTLCDNRFYKRACCVSCAALRRSDEGRQ